MTVTPGRGSGTSGGAGLAAAAVHAAAWMQMFDAYLLESAQGTGTSFVPFDPGSDYERYMDGISRADGPGPP